MQENPRGRGVPLYRGRPLARPHDHIEDQGLGFDLGTLMGRRQILRALGAGVVGLGIAACGKNTGPSGTASAPSTGAPGSASAPSTGAPGSASAPSASALAEASAGEIPEETAGPYPGDGSNGPDVLEQSGIVRSDIRTSFGAGGATAQGIPMTLELTIQDMANGGIPYAGAAVYVWHCDREGRYSLYSEGVTGENYLRGVQIADAAGRVRFTSVFPACYTGRWPHIHFEVYPDRASITDAAKTIATSQVALPKNACDAVYAQPGYQQSVTNLSGLSLATDNVFGDDGGASQLGTVTGDVHSGYTVTLPVRVDTRTTPAAGRPPGGQERERIRP